MIGRLRHRLTLQRPVQTPDGGGGFAVTWQNAAQMPVIYAALMALSLDDIAQHRQRRMAATHRIRIRHRADIAQGMRFLHSGRAYYITAAADADGTGRWLDILAEER